MRAWSPEALTRRVDWLKAAGVAGGWVEPEGGKGPAYEFTVPDGHRVRIYYETSKYAPPARERPVKVCSGGYLGFDPDDDPVVWTQAEYGAKPGWGAPLPATFRSYGTPPSGAPEESDTAGWPAAGPHSW